MSSNKRENMASFGRILLLFVGILLLFLYLTASQTLTKLLNEQNRREILKIESSMDEVVSKTTLRPFLFNQIQQILKIYGDSDSNFSSISNFFKESQSIKKTLIQGYFYENFKLVKHLNSPAEDVDFFADIMEKMHLEGDQLKEAQREIHEKIMVRFGPGNRLELIKDTYNDLRVFKKLEKNNFYFWCDLPDKKSIFLVITEFPEFEERFQIFRKDGLFKNCGVGISGKNSCIPPENTMPDQLLAARLKTGLESSNHTFAFGKIWFFLEDESGAFWCKAIQDKNKDSETIVLTRILSIVSIVLCITSIALYLLAFLGIFPGKNFCEFMDSISIKYRIAGLFSMASFFPVLFTLLIGATTIGDRIEIIENQVTSASISNLNRLEKMVSKKLEASEKMCREIRETIKTVPATEKLFSAFLKKYNLPRQMSRLEVRDGGGEILFTTDDKEIHGVTQAMDVFSRIALKQHSPSRMGLKANMVTPAEIVSESILSTDEIGMATIMRQSGKQWLFRMGTFPTVWYWDVYPEISSGPAFIAVTAQVIAIYSKQIKEELTRVAKDKNNILLSTPMNSYYASFKLFPQIENMDNEKLISAAITSYRTGKVVKRNAVFEGKEYWLTVKPEKNISSHVFLNLVSKADRLKVLTQLKFRLAFGGIIALLVSLLGANLITRLIISPVNDLAMGIEAIRERNHDFRIPVRRDDEFGTLSNAFNTVIEDLKELEYGRVVQTSLLPSKIIAPEGYELACFRASATDLAGDYHDILPLNDGRTGIILGDVTGHGISAALAMAMAKATVDYMKLEGTLFPGPLMDQLNALFNRELKPRHKFMTLVTLVLEPESGKLEVDNAGQSYPYYYNYASKTAEEVKIPSMPLGATKKRRSKPEVKMMQPGDAVILYSDGIIECSDETEEMFGYDRFYETYVELLDKGLSAEKVLEQMIDALETFRKPGPYPDDVTLVILRRLK